MNIYKDFIQQLRRVAFDEVYILLWDITPKLSEYVRLLTDVTFEDGSYHIFYGEVKRIIVSFLVYYNDTIDETIKEADRYSNNMTKDELMMLMEKTISTHQTIQIEFGNNFLPIKSEEEKIIYEDIQSKYDNFMKKVFEFRAKLEMMQKKNNILEFAKVHFEIVVKKTSDVLKFAHSYLALLLADSVNQIRTSLEENELRLRNNLLNMREQYDDTINNLLNQLYDKNKENLLVTRRHEKCPEEVAEVERGIQIIRNKIVTVAAEFPLSHLELEVSFWQKKLADFNKVAANLIKLKTEQENVLKQEQIYNSMRTTELPGAKLQCWENMGANFSERKVYLKEKLLIEARALLTFFACKGTDRIIYTDNIGPYYLDEFNHKVYVLDYGLKLYHVNCEGDFKSVPEDLYYFDKNGRYIIQDGEKIYQCANCTSQYKLADNTLLNKVTKDCGHAEATNNHCKMAIKDPNNVVILPDFEPKDITSTLDASTVKYLWDSFGSILPNALYDVGSAKDNNPIHLLAHKLLHHHYNRTWTERRLNMDEADEYRANIFKDRKEKAVAASKAWKAKQVVRRKPEESDDTQERAVYDAQIAQQAFINSLNFYDT